jgi:hypothetical protein
LERRVAAAERAADEREREAEAEEEGDRKEPAAALQRRGDESRRANQGGGGGLFLRLFPSLAQQVTDQVGSTDRNRGAQKRPEGILVYKRLTGGPELLLRGKYILYVVQSVVSLIFILFFSLAAASL